MIFIKAQQRKLTAAGGMDISQADFLKHREQDAFRRLAIERIDHNGISYVANANVLIGDVAHQAAAAHIGFDTDSVIRTVNGQVNNANSAYTSVSLAPDRHSMSGVKVVPQDGHVGCRSVLPCLNCDVVISGPG